MFVAFLCDFVVVVVGLRCCICLVCLCSVLLLLVFLYCVMFVCLLFKCMFGFLFVRMLVIVVGVGFRCFICLVHYVFCVAVSCVVLL